MTPDLTTRYLGLKLKNPLIAAAGPPTEEFSNLPRLEAAGASAIVLPSLWEGQIEHYDLQLTRLRETGAGWSPEALDFFPEIEDHRGSPDEYLQLIEEAKSAVTIPVIASLNGVSEGGWIRYARMIESAGADALELNIYFIATNPDRGALEVEQQYLDLVAAIRAELSIPLAVKIGPFFSSMANFAKRLERSGADGLVLFNRFLQPDIDLETLSVGPHIVLSDSREVRLPLRWIAILRDKLQCSLAATSGVHSPADAIKLLLAGADAVMLMSVLLQRGIEQIADILSGVEAWISERDYQSVEQLKGSLSQANCPDPAAFERANYMKALVTYSSKAN
jgi:dihydroorotate dehydrogenase (fumarate)